MLGSELMVWMTPAACHDEPEVSSRRSSSTTSRQPIFARWYSTLHPTTPPPITTTFACDLMAETLRCIHHRGTEAQRRNNISPQMNSDELRLSKPFVIPTLVIPAKAGIHLSSNSAPAVVAPWTPAFAGVTAKGSSPHLCLSAFICG